MYNKNGKKVSENKIKYWFVVHSSVTQLLIKVSGNQHKILIVIS